MPQNFKILAFVSSLLFFAVFLGLIRRKSINPFYAFLWFAIAVLFLSAVLFEKAYKALADFLQLTDASFIFVAGMIYFLMIYVLHLSIRISELSDRIQELISHSAILERDLRHARALLDDEITRKSREDPAAS
jgi:FlaA1/EpsC-like NDP-sugar epimerase